MRQLLDQLPEPLRQQALTHPAFASARGESFERLEFLGDSVLDLVVTDAIFERHPDLDEGELSKVRAATVSREACAEVAREAGLGAAMVELAADFGAAHGATAERLAGQKNALAALTESVIGGGFLALGYSAVAPLVLAAFEDRITHALTHRVDSKSHLQELASRMGTAVSYDEVGEDGPPHDRRFTMAARFVGSDDAARTDGSSGTETDVGELQAEGSGRSKQEAQQAAATALLAKLDQG
ncbi:MAG: ribonuclease [Thermoleophilia bacterium]|nr:ribonuclease [Thermoleophilia bacterium]